MSDNLPKWADEEWSIKLPHVREAGESAAIEFKQQFPGQGNKEQGHRLAQELAALGTSGGGAVLIGVNDNGDLVGIDANNGGERDSAVERAQGIVDKVRPALKKEIHLAAENDKTVLIIELPAQEDPIYYFDHRPYIRDGRRSRPATPSEVQECVWAHPSSKFKRDLECMELEEKRKYHDLKLSVLSPKQSAHPQQ